MFCIKEKDGPITADSNMVTTCQIFAVKNAVPVKPAAEDWNRRFSLKGIREENEGFLPFHFINGHLKHPKILVLDNFG